MRRLALALALASALAVSSLPAPARAAGGIGQFVLRCLYSHSLPDDPIVFPGEPGASHLHDFFGNDGVDAFSTEGSMLAAGTTCRVPSDTAGYWAPTAFVNGVRMTPTVMRIYYLGSPDRTVETIPAGLQMVAGNRAATSPEENPHVAWYCGATKAVKTPRMGEPYDCTPWSSHSFVDGIIAIIDFPNCWNGTGLRPEDVVYPVNGVCPSGFGHVLPIISERVHYGVMNPMNPDGTQGLTLSSGPPYTLHADFWNTWQQDRLDQLVSECIVARVHCGSVDATSRVDWMRQFGTTGYDQAEAAAPDGDGGSYVVGLTNASLSDQDLREGSDAFIRRYDAEGRELWTTRFGTKGVDQALAIASSRDGVFVAGSTDGRFPKQEAKGGLDAWIARFDPDGTRIWLRQFGTALEDRAAALYAEGRGVFVAGATGGRLFRQRGSGGSDAFVAWFDGDGDVGWARTIGGKGEDEASALAVRNGIVHIAGSTQGLRSAPGDLDAFVATLTTEGRLRWTRRLGDDAADDAATALVARARSMFVSGWTAGALPQQTAEGGRDAFVVKLGPNGYASWVRQFGSPADDETSAVYTVGKGLYVAGSAMGELPDATHLGGSDAFVRKYSPGYGTEMWTMQLGTEADDVVSGMAGDRRGVVLAGATDGTLEGFTNAGDGDVLLIRVAFT